MSTQFDLTQTILALSAAANRATGALGNTKALTTFLGLAVGDGGQWKGRFAGKHSDEIQDLKVTGFLKSVGDQLIGQDWRITWGPCVYEFNDRDQKLMFRSAKKPDMPGLDNGMFVAYSPSQDVYVVAIAATNVTSLFDWVFEDADVFRGHMVAAPINLDKNLPDQYQTASLTKAQLTAGTARGLQILCRQLSDPQHGTIEHYLTKVAKRTAKTRLVFTGHSLAAALSPAIAYQLYNELGRAKWSKPNIFVMPTAGASPGNTMFAAFWSAKFPATPVGAVNPGNGITHFNTLYWNTKDIVPHAWTHFRSFYRDFDLKAGTLLTNLGEVEGKALCELLVAGLTGAELIGLGSHLARLGQE